ncbi:hypothetical protein C8R45DRAFT_1005567 [Mycena sanguinolenta]|nr:hypothetical protein C8R45DRAFT_1005567 [Mycena sanguinolenta]
MRRRLSRALRVWWSKWKWMWWWTHTLLVLSFSRFLCVGGVKSTLAARRTRYWRTDAPSTRVCFCYSTRKWCSGHVATLRASYSAALEPPSSTRIVPVSPPMSLGGTQTRLCLRLRSLPLPLLLLRFLSLLRVWGSKLRVGPRRRRVRAPSRGSRSWRVRARKPPNRAARTARERHSRR